MSSQRIDRSPIGGIDWWEKQREEHDDFEIFFGADGIMPSAYRLLAEGQPVPLDRIAATISRPVAEVEAALRRQPGTDWDERGRLVGFGVTLRPTPHRLTFDDGRTVFTWCASDSLVVPAIVGRPVTLESPCAATGRPIRVRVTPERVESVDPPTAVVSMVRPDRVDDIRGEVCSLGSFAVSEDAAAEWLAAHPEGMVHSVSEDFRLHREVAERFGWTQSRSSGAHFAIARPDGAPTR
jgi:alkylmercury lyase